LLPRNIFVIFKVLTHSLIKNMKKYFPVLLIVLVLFVLIILWSLFREKPQLPSVKKEVTTPPVVAEEKFSYDGTYSGTFNYEYQDVERFSGKTLTEWIPGSFTLVLTLKTLSVESEVVFLDATNAVVSDPSFGTGSNGVDPVSSFGGPINLTLPRNPAEQKTDSSASMYLYFNLGEDYETKMIEIKSGAVKVSPDGKTLSRNPDWGKNPTAGKTELPAWKALTPGMDTTFRFGGTFGTSGVYDRHFKYGDWSLTKISP